ncbi:MAG TPA: hypothetical protein VGR72_01815 [Candidatus Acidoferrales bacterium]|nr:hypothetical protein [Candidatus Acidoferrales bacterium]
MHLSHFSAMLFCAAAISIAFAWLSRRTRKERILCALRYFLYFVVVSLALAWLMFPFSR